MSSSKSRFLNLRNSLKTWGRSPSRPHESAITCPSKHTRQQPRSTPLTQERTISPRFQPRIPRRKPTTSQRRKLMNMSSTDNALSRHEHSATQRNHISSPSSSSNDPPSLTASHRDEPRSASRLPRHTNEATLEECFNLRGSDDPSSSSLHDMLCSTKATVVTVPLNGGWSCDRDNDVLRDYFRVRTNVVLDSPHPSRVPHIVVSPVQETTEDYYTSWDNRVPMYQEATLLCVPRFDMSRWSSMPGQSPESYWPNSMRSSIDRGEPTRCFSQSKFNQQRSERETSKMSEQIVAATQCELLKAVVIEASTLALSLQQRYENLDVFASIEKAFQWSDPAEPILRMATYPGVTILESHNPFMAPHIMICTPPQQDPWISFSNALNDPQDAGYGRYLVVPSRMVNFINFEGSPFNDDDDEFDALVEYSSDADSPPDTPEPETPTDLEDGDYFPATEWQYDSDDEDESLIQPPATKWSSGSAWNEPSNKLDAAPSIISPLPPRPSKPIFYMDDEDEDDLPPLDDWYLSVAARNGLTIATAS